MKAVVVSRSTTPERYIKTSQGWLSEQKVIDLLARGVRLVLKGLSEKEEKALRYRAEGLRAKARLEKAAKALKARRPHVRVK